MKLTICMSCTEICLTSPFVILQVPKRGLNTLAGSRIAKPQSSEMLLRSQAYTYNLHKDITIGDPCKTNPNQNESVK